MTEYWLQKKSLSGWSVVTWYSDLAQARTNYLKCIGNGMSGYSWRLVTVEVVEQAMLDEVTEVEAPTMPDPPVNNGWTATPSNNKNSGWGATPTAGWENGFKSDNPGVTDRRSNLEGKVWMIHHSNRDRLRVHENEVNEMLARGWERGGPRTQFRE